MLVPLLDGLVLGGARWSADGTLHLTKRLALLPWLESLRTELHGFGLVAVLRTGAQARLHLGPHPALEAASQRWLAEDRRRLRLPSWLDFTAELLAAWYAGGGAATNRGYALRLSARRLTLADAEALAARLASAHRWEVATFQDRGPMLRIARSGDRRQFQRMVAGRLAHLPCFAGRLHLAESQPCTEAESARRRHPARLNADGRAALRARAEAEPHLTFDELAAPLGISGRHVGKLLRQMGLRRRSVYQRLRPQDVEVILAEVAGGKSQRQVAREHNLSQAHVWYLLTRHRR